MTPAQKLQQISVYHMINTLLNLTQYREDLYLVVNPHYTEKLYFRISKKNIEELKNYLDNYLNDRLNLEKESRDLLSFEPYSIELYDIKNEEILQAKKLQVK